MSPGAGQWLISQYKNYTNVKTLWAEEQISSCRDPHPTSDNANYCMRVYLKLTFSYTVVSLMKFCKGFRGV